MEIDTNRKSMRDFLVVFHCNYYAYLISFLRYRNL